ncbi:MAG: hypothetical protein HKN25_04955 [Pyrinomonadaceae bacterium]|nr:hypothetical protein [Pyrinomonadaceae bacterium]
MSHLQLVKPLSELREEQEISRESSIEIAGLRLVRGSLTELIGEASSGKTGHAIAVISKLTQEGEVCAVIDTSNSFDPISAHSNGAWLENLLWIRCGGDIENAMKAADLLLQAKGFGAVWINFGNMKAGQLSNVPNSFWYRFRTFVKASPTLLVVTARESLLGSSAQQSYLLTQNRSVWSGEGKFKLIKEFRLRLKPKNVFSTILSSIERSYEDV